MKEIKELTGLYSLTKTIGLELKPVGKTQQLIESKKLIEQDDQRAEDYKIVKDIIDRYHKDFIDKCLNSNSSLKFEIMAKQLYVASQRVL